MHKGKETSAIQEETRVILQCDFLDLRDTNIILKYEQQQILQNYSAII